MPLYGTARNNKGKIEKNKKIKPGKCIFPFMYKWKNHEKCYNTPKGDICATEISFPRRTLKRYGYCKKKELKKRHQKKGTKKKALKKRHQKKGTTKTITLNRKIKKSKNQTIKVKKLRKRLKIPNKKIDLKKKKKRKVKKQNMTYNEDFIKLLDQLETIMSKKGEHFRARAYAKAREAIIVYNKPITDVKQLKGVRGIGSTILTKFQTYVDTGTLSVIEKAKTDPLFVFTEIYGVGPKKANELIKKHNVKSIAELRQRQDELLNDVQKKGLKHYEDILKRIPRKEIQTYEKHLLKIFETVKNPGSTLQILGSYRRGAKNSGDIDICISDPDNDPIVFVNFIDRLIEKNILIEVLSRGKTKSLGVSKLPRKPARRIDFMFTPHQELPFALLYFTGSKAFNTVMRKRALDLGYSMNEHGFHKMVKGKKANKLQRLFESEEDVFNFLGMVYKGPTKRIDGNAVVLKKNVQEEKEEKEQKVQTTKKKKKKKINGKKFIREFLKDGQPVLDQLDEDHLSEMIRAANKGYYCNNKPLMTDEEYDILKEYIEDKFPDNQAILEGHTMCSIAVEKKKAQLPYQMWSMDKFKTEDAVNNWLRQGYKGPYLISAKLDGISALYTTEGDEPRLYTRGNGRVGQDISHAIQYLQLPQKKGITIRGELLMTKQKFEQNWSDTFANVRNMIAGTANAKESMPKRWADIDFVAYEVIQPELKPSGQLKFLEKQKVITVIYSKNKKFNTSLLSQYLVDWRENYDYDIDGIIVADDNKYPRTSKNPKHAFAFKMVLDDQMVESKVVNVIWSPSKDGYLKPKIQIQPVKIGGVEITFATVHNAEFVIKNKIGIGALVQIIRSGDVIPKVEKVVKPAKNVKLPTEYNFTWNATKKDLVLTNADQNEIVILKQIDDFFNKLEVVGLGRGNIKRIMDAGYNTLPMILQMGIEDFEEVEGFKKKLSTKIYSSIQDRLRDVNIAVLAGASNIFARGLGTKRLVLILDAYPDILTSKVSDVKKVEMISKLDGFKEKTALMFVPHINKFLEFLNSIGQIKKLKQMKKQTYDKSHPLYDKKIVITGFRDKNLQKQIEKLGGKVGSSVSKKTFIVLVKTMDDDTGKADKARNLGVTLMTPEKFVSKFNI